MFMIKTQRLVKAKQLKMVGSKRHNLK